VLAIPFLWFQGRFAVFLAALCVIWAGYSLLGAVCYLSARDFPRAKLQRQSNRATLLPFPTEASPKAGRARRLTGCFILAASLVLAMVPAFAWVRVPQLRQSIISMAPFVLLAGFWLTPFLRRLSGSVMKFDAEDDEPAPRIFTVAAAAFILFQAITATIYVHHSRDDGYYFAAVLDYQHAPVLNDQEPTHREGLPVPTVHRTLAWELWGAVICHLTGLTPMGLFRCLLPGPLILLSYAAYHAVLSTFLPRRWIPIALIGLSAVHLWGIANNETAINFFLTRPWQGKCVLIHTGVPLLAFLLIRFAARPSLALWLSLLACVLFGMSVSLSAIFMMAIQAACLTVALVPQMTRRPFLTIAGILAALAPLVFTGVIILVNLPDFSDAPDRYPHLRTWYNHVNFYLRAGSAEVFLAMTLPLIGAFFLDNWRKPYVVGFSCVLGLTFANPNLYAPVCLYLTSYYTHERVWWLFPVGPGLGVLLALVVRYLSRSLGHGRGIFLPLMLTAVGLAVAWNMPGLYVWGPGNVVWGSMQATHLAENFEKMPAGLVPLADILEQDPDIAEARILCNEPIATYLTPYSRNFRFVQTRPPYTAVGFTRLGKGEEARQRHELASALGSGLSGDRARAKKRLLLEFKVKYAVTGPGDRADDFLSANGYEILQRRGSFALWIIQHSGRARLSPQPENSQPGKSEFSAAAPRRAS